MDINLSYPAWFLIICISAALGLSWWLYAKNQFNSEKPFWSFPNIVLFALRFIILFLISFFLLSPFIKKNFEVFTDPVIVIAADNSRSVLLNKDSSFYRREFTKKLNDFSREVGKDFEVREYTFAEKHNNGLDLNFNGTRTDISSFLEYLSQQYYNKNIGAIILASDGIYNEGMNPLFNDLDPMIPVYTIALGDTSASKDLYFEDFKYNSIAFLNNIVQVEAKLTASKAKGEEVYLDIFHSSKVVSTKQIRISSDRFTVPVNYRFDATVPGMNRIDFVIRKLDGEISYENNKQTIFIDVIESRKKILIIGNSPHPDLAALKNSISSNKNYELKTVLADELQKENLYNSLEEYDLLILHQLPSRKHPSEKIFNIADKADIPLLFVIGQQTNIAEFNRLGLGVQIGQRRNMFENATAAYNPDFSYFIPGKNLEKLTKDYPPLFVPFGNYILTAGHQVLLFQKQGNVKTNKPLITFFEEFDKRYGVIFGTGIWRWPLTEFRLQQNRQTTTDLMAKSIQYLSVKSDRRFFKLKDPKNIFDESENVRFDLEFYNPSYEMKKGAKINMTIYDEEGKDYNYSFLENENFYTVDAGSFNEGVYQYTIKTSDQEKDDQLNGEFIVRRSSLEEQQTRADHQLLKNIADQTGGKLIYHEQMDELVQELKNRNDIKPISYFNFTSKKLIEFRWLFFLLLALLALEWFARKFYGSY